MPETLTHIGRYAIESELGRGAMGVVFKAFDPLVERTVAIKTIPLNVEAPELLVHRLQLEAKSVGQLEHPNIVTLYDAGETNGVFYLAMQFIQGETLRDRITRQRWFSLGEIQQFLRQICSALDYAHRHGVIHRDIKPSNIMISSEGLVKLTDFGIAKLTGGTTSTGLIMGTPSYMSPEQALGKPLDGRSDIFSLGSILYELFTGGEQAFPGSQASTVIYRIVHEPPSPFTALLPGFDPSLESIVLKALGKQPEQRYQTCANLAAALDTYVPAAAPVRDEASATRLLGGSRPDLAPTANLSVTAIPMPRHSRLIWPMAALLLIVTLAAIWWISQQHRPIPQIPASNSSDTMNPSASPAAVSGGDQPVRPSAIDSPKNPPVNSSSASPPPATISVAKKPPAKAPARIQPAPLSARGVTPAPAPERPELDSFQGQMLKGDLAFQQSRYQDALALYSKAHQIDPSNREVRRKLTVVLTLLGRPEEARKYK